MIIGETLTEPTGPLPDDLIATKEATKHTERINAAVRKELPFSDRTSVEITVCCLVAIESNPGICLKIFTDHWKTDQCWTENY